MNNSELVLCVKEIDGSTVKTFKDTNKIIRWFLMALVLIGTSVSLPAAYVIDTTNEETTGLFFNASEAGWGIGITQQGDIIFVTLYTYDSSNQPKWYVVSNCIISGDSCTGVLYEVSGGSALTDDWDSTSKVTTEVGTAAIQFTDTDNATLSMVVNGISVSKTIQRQVFRVLTPDAPMNALVWNASESGWGATLTQQSDVVFVVIYTYDNNGFPVWYVASNCEVSGDTCTGTLYSVTGGSAITDSWDGSNKMVKDVGQVIVSLLEDDTGTLTFNIDGLEGSKVIARQIWATDADHDGLSDVNDNCPNNENPNQADTDGDGTGDLCEEATVGHQGWLCLSRHTPTTEVACVLDNWADAVGTYSFEGSCPGSGSRVILLDESGTLVLRNLAENDDIPLILDGPTGSAENVVAFGQDGHELTMILENGGVTTTLYQPVTFGSCFANMTPLSRDCFESTGAATITLDVTDTSCENGITLDLASAGFDSAVVELDPPPYTTGTDIETELVQLELAADTTLGTVVIRERTDATSLGQITNVEADSNGDFVRGDSFFDVFVEVEISGMTLNTGDQPIRLDSGTILELPAIGTDYLTPPGSEPVMLIEAEVP